MTGTKLQHYEITSQLGKGGMGEVWRARDTKLGRDVAIKTLPPEFARDSDRVVRLEREAKLLASVNHPNVAAIYGLEESSGTRFLVLELIDGETLGERLQRSALSMPESLTFAHQIAQALEAAHEKGVIHRDLKPGNIKITPEGKVKVLDFGLAKALDGPSRPGSESITHSPTLSIAATQEGIILGTAGYMSPEQARGEATDKRADIWAFGCVLFEMLTRRRTFEGRTVSDVLAGVLRADPEWSSLPHDLHPRIRLLLERCLEKEPKDRYRDIADARVDIEKALAEKPASRPVAAPAASTRQLTRWIMAVVVAALLAGVAVWYLKPAPDVPTMVNRFDYDLPEGQQFRNTGRQVLAISPDGKSFLYNTTAGVFLRSMDSFDARLIPGTEASLNGPAFSPDGEWIVYWSPSDTKLKKITVTGGTAITLCDVATSPLGISWSKDHSILYGMLEGIMRVPENGGSPELIVKTGPPDQTGEVVYGPQLLPDGKSVLFTLSTFKSGVTNWDGAQIAIQSIGANDRKVIWRGGAHALFVPTGHVLYMVGGALFAIRFDADSKTVQGSPVQLAEDIGRNAQNGQTGYYGVSDTGTLIYLRGANTNLTATRRVLGFADQKGAVTPLKVPPAPYLHPRISPDGTRLAVQTLEDNNRSAIWVYDLSETRAIQQLTQAGNNSRPIWTPDSRRLTFTSDREGPPSIYWQPADGSGVAERLTKPEEKFEHWPDSWSADGKTLSFTRYGGLGNQSVWTLSLDGREAKDFGVKESGGSAFSPDGKWLAYRQQSDTGAQIFVQPFPPTGAVYKVTQRGGSYPLWSLNQLEMFYRRPLTGNNPTASGGAADQLVRVEVSTRGIIGYTNEQSIPILGFLTFFGSRDYDVTKDGQRFLMVFPADRSQTRASARPQIDIVVNWFTELRERVQSK
jgi:eukaryotic-like serine/threonine-protein kinase